MRRAATVVSIALCAAAGTTACGSARPAGGASTSAARAPIALATRDLIPTRTLDLDPGLSLYDVVARYWPQVLRPPTPGVPGTPRLDPQGDIVGVYVDQMFAGGQEQLRSIRSSAVASIRRLTQSEEFIRFGRSHPGGAVVIKFR